MSLSRNFKMCGRDVDLMVGAIFDGIDAYCSLTCLQEVRRPQLAPVDGQLAPDGDGIVL